MKRVVSLLAVVAVLMLLPGAGGAVAQDTGPVSGQSGPLGTAFTYQGLLKDGSGNPITNTCNFLFGLYDELSGGNAKGISPQTAAGVTVTNGYFTVSLDFGTGAFDGYGRWLDIQVKCGTETSYIQLSPRQPLTAAPYALYAVNADTLGGQPATAFQQHYQNMVVVAKSGGDFTSISAALATITTASEANPYLIKVAPGIYTEMAIMKPYVDIEGSGELTTKITQIGSTSPTTGTVIGTNNAELRFLTVENTGGAAFATAIFSGGAALRLTHVTATASGGTVRNIAVLNHNSSSPAMTNVTASASGGTDSSNYGVYNYSSSSPAMTNVTASASGGTGSSNYGVYNDNSSSPAMTNVTASASGGTGSSNYGVYNYNSSSPAMTNVTASTSGGSYNYGVFTQDSFPTMTYVNATAFRGTDANYGVYNSGSSTTMTNVMATACQAGGTLGNYGVYNSGGSPTMTNVTATACQGDGASGYGVYNASSSPTIQNSVIGTSDGITYGIYNKAGFTGTYTVTIRNSQITGSSTIYQDSNYTTKVGASQLAGGAATGGNFICVVTYKSNFAELTSSCQ